MKAFWRTFEFKLLAFVGIKFKINFLHTETFEQFHTLEKFKIALSSFFQHFNNPSNLQRRKIAHRFALKKLICTLYRWQWKFIFSALLREKKSFTTDRNCFYDNRRVHKDVKWRRKLYFSRSKRVSALNVFRSSQSSQSIRKNVWKIILNYAQKV